MKHSSTPHEISMGYRINLAPHVSHAAVLRAMIHAIRDGSGHVPLGIQATWTIRGSEKDFAETIRSSNAGLRKLMERRLVRDLEGL